jgi:hypothetical protein
MDILITNSLERKAYFQNKLENETINRMRLLYPRYLINRMAFSLNLGKPDAEIIAWIIIMSWKTWNEEWKARNKKFKEKNRYIAEAANMQRIIDINIIYHCREYLPDELNSQLKFSVEESLSQNNVFFDEWLIIFKSIMYQEVIKRNKKTWREAEKHF